MIIKVCFYCALLSCIFFIHCDECFRSCDSGPFFADLELRLTVNDQNTDVPIEIYEGKYDDGLLIIQDTVSSNKLVNGRAFYNLEAGISYAAVAIYQDGAKEILAIDGGEMSLSTDDCNCDFPNNLTLNLRLAK